MKKTVRIFLLVALCTAMISIAAVSVSADVGPKPSLTVTLKNAPETYYLDLLVNYDGEYRNIYGEELEKLDATMMGVLQNYSEEGWYAALSHGTNVPLFGSVVPDGNVSHFSYFGLPDTYKIIVVTPDGGCKVSDVMKTTMYQEKITVDYYTMSVKSESNVVISYILQFLSTFVPTLLIEVLMLPVFRISIPKNLLCVTLVNLITQAALTFLLANSMMSSGFSTWTYVLFAVAELGIMMVEALIYLFALKTEKRWVRPVYAVAANAVSLIVGELFVFIAGSFIW